MNTTRRGSNRLGPVGRGRSCRWLLSASSGIRAKGQVAKKPTFESEWHSFTMTVEFECRRF